MEQDEKVDSYPPSDKDSSRDPKGNPVSSERLKDANIEQ